MRSLAYQNSLCLTGLLVALACVVATGTAQSQKIYDGNWWTTVSAEEQEGFLDGYVVCYYDEVKGSDRFDRPYAEYRERITAFYEQASPRRKQLVADVLHQFRFKPGEDPREGGETGFFDGQSWREMRPENRLWFLEGFLWCYSNRAGNPRGKFSRDAADYVALIDQWYEIDDEKQSINANRVDKKVLTVLFKFVDKTCNKIPRSR